MLRAMRVSPNRMMVLVVLGVALASGCAYGEVRQVIRAQFASEFNCPEVQLRKRDSWYAQDNPNQFKVSGCGKIRTYTCDKEMGLVSYDKPACKWVEGDADAPGAASSPSNPATESMPNDNAEPSPPSDEPSSEPSSSNDDSASGSSDGLDSSADITSDSSSDSGKKSGKAKASVGLKAGHK
jgi:hypothetical protein